MTARKTVIGWREWAMLPELGVDGIKVKVDTGAQTSCLHAIHIRRLDDDRVRFELHPLQRRSDVTVTCIASLVGERLVTSSTGHRERRPVIRTPIAMGGQQWPIEITLTNRDSMGFRMLLGRQAMRGHLIVDAGESFLLGKRPAGPNSPA
ncbi:RimK/LysX family protein [Methylonatrum kenyense]|uniref:ATP-dependent zinc protease family protein n=1 Tax=Methylonatrum kenyense TaxID=455253 RepID=UPI0020BFC6E8|nr:RimK/LysX family protein [Methylonatrum kenyense]MCK8517301.1 RimK/LysX family protein [Methylonatrum kenyense]